MGRGQASAFALSREEQVEGPARRDYLARFQLHRLEFALARRVNPANELYRDLIDRSILSLYTDCVEAGAATEARQLIERYRSSNRRIGRA